jgi:hypothetical protein
MSRMAEYGRHDKRPSFDRFSDMSTRKVALDSSMSSRHPPAGPDMGRPAIQTDLSGRWSPPHKQSNSFSPVDDDRTQQSSSEVHAPLVRTATSNYQDLGELIILMTTCQIDIPLTSYNLSEYAEPYAEPYDPTRAKPMADKGANTLSKVLGGSRYPLEQRIQDKKRGIPRQKYPFVGSL